MEFVKKQVIAALTANGDDTLDFVIPAGYSRWSLHILPIHAGLGVPDASSADVLYFVNGAFYQTNPAGSAAMTTNKVNVVTREDVIGRIQVKLTNGASPPDGDCVVELWGSRS